MFRPNKGFTLIEVLVGLVVFSLISVCLYNSFHIAVELKKRSLDDNKAYREARWTMAQLGHDLENLTWYDFSGSYEDKNAFVGNEKEISFLIHTPEGLKVVWYYLKPNGPGKESLCRMASDFSHFLELDRKELEKEKEQGVILSDAVSSFRVSYSQKNGGGWENTWGNKKDIPGAVKVDLILRAGGNKQPLFFERKIFIPFGSQVFRTQPF